MPLVRNHIAVSFGALRAHKTEEELARNGDFYGLYVRKRMERFVGGLNSPMGKRLGYLAIFGGHLSLGLVYAGIEQLSGDVITSGPVHLAIQKDLITAHYFGDKHSIPNLDRDLGKVARKLFAYPGELPDMITATSSRDIMSVISRKYGLELCERNYYGHSDDVLAMADSARLIRGRGPCPDRKIYQASMPTEEFIERFAFPSHHGQEA